MAQTGKRGGSRTTPRQQRPPDPVEDFALHRDGTITVIVDGTAYRLRRPILDEYVELVEAFEEANDVVTNGVVVDPAEIDPETNEPRRARLDRKVLHGPGSPFVAWWVRVVETLGETDDDVRPGGFPAWAIMGDTADKAVQHWRTVPLAPGSPTTPTVSPALARAVAEVIATQGQT